MKQQPSPRCHFMNCRKPVTHTVQRLWQIPGRAPFGLQHCCDDHIPGSAKFDGNSQTIKRVLAAGRGLTPFYRVEPIADAS